jgi:small subunit ribosomal protein S2
MAPYIFTQKAGVHIIDLGQTLENLEKAKAFISSVTERGEKVLFVGTKRQAAGIVREEAERAGQLYITERWLGGTLTNFRTIRERVRYLEDLEAGEASGQTKSRYTKKEARKLAEKREKLNHNLSGIKAMTTLPGALVVVDVNRESIAIREAKNLNIPVVAIVDTNANPEQATYPIPANDDAIRSVKLIIGQLADAALSGKTAHDKKPAEAPAEVAA